MNKEIYVIETDKCCFISDCNATSGYNYTYHHCEIMNYYFNGEKPERTFYPNWLKISKFPEKVEKLISGKRKNERYRILNPDAVSKAYPEEIPYKESKNYDEYVLDSLYKLEYDEVEPYMEDITKDFTIVKLMKIDNFKEAESISFEGVQRLSFKDVKYEITNANVQHSLIDKMIFPEVLLHNCVSKFTSKQMYDITRNYIRNNIDSKYAKITSDYDFCFEVRKLIPLPEPEAITYQNIFARTKKERERIRTSIKRYNESLIFSMTNDIDKYQKYPIIPEMVANSESELKEKVNKWLEGIISEINKPLVVCPHCHGNGVIYDESKVIEFNY